MSKAVLVLLCLVLPMQSLWADGLVADDVRVLQDSLKFYLGDDSLAILNTDDLSWMTYYSKSGSTTYVLVGDVPLSNEIFCEVEMHVPVPQPDLGRCSLKLVCQKGRKTWLATKGLACKDSKPASAVRLSAQ